MNLSADFTYMSGEKAGWASPLCVSFPPKVSTYCAACSVVLSDWLQEPGVNPNNEGALALSYFTGIKGVVFWQRAENFLLKVKVKKPVCYCLSGQSHCYKNLSGLIWLSPSQIITNDPTCCPLLVVETFLLTNFVGRQSCIPGLVFQYTCPPTEEKQKCFVCFFLSCEGVPAFAEGRTSCLPILDQKMYWNPTTLANYRV